MIEGFEDGYLVRVRAQVMSRDDSSGGWVPLGGGGLSNVSVRKRLRPGTVASTGTQQQQDQPTKPKYDYLIYGIRISDQSIVLSCTIKKDFEYNKVMPTFHHWKTGDKKFGLTFQTAADARAFDKGVRTAVEDLLDGISDIYSLTTVRKDVGDDEVFMTLNLPQDKESRSSSDSSVKGSDSLRRIHYIGREKDSGLLQSKQTSPYSPPKDEKGESYTYVQLRAMHEYIYPMMDEQKQHQQQLQPHHESLSAVDPPLKKGTGGGMSLEPIQHQPPLPLKTKYIQTATKPASVATARAQQTLCRHCHEFFTEERNARGACEYAPDRFRSAIDFVSCIGCAQCLCYHCASDAEGDFAQHPCDCSREDNWARRWLCLAALSLLVPCLWLYPPLKSCHWCGVRLSWCGGRHRK